MVEIAAGIEQCFPEKVFELHLAHRKSAAVSIGGDRIAAHGFGAHAQRQVGLVAA